MLRCRLKAFLPTIALIFSIAANDTVTICPSGYFISPSGNCQLCTICQDNYSVLRPCTTQMDAECSLTDMNLNTNDTVPIDTTNDSVPKIAVIDTKSVCANRQQEITTENGSYCCGLCGKGYGVSLKCNVTNDTTCEPCADGKTFSDVRDHYTECRLCKVCPVNSSELKPCTAISDTICGCNEGFYRHRSSGQCLPCSACTTGWGAMRGCTRIQNTVCRVCPNGTYSEVMSATQGCLICTVCQEERVMLQECTSVQDTMCGSGTLYAKYKNLNGQSAHSVDVEKDAALTGRTGKLVPRDIDVIPIYCSLLGLVVVGLFVYVVIKHARRVKSQRDKCRHLGDVESSPVHHADSGFFMEQQIAPLTGKSRYCQISLARRKDIAGKLCKPKNNGGDWKKLALRLGYNKEKISQLCTLTQSYNTNTAEFFLDEWSRHENSTISKLSKALNKINRQEVSKLLHVDSVATELRPLKSSIVL